MKTSNALFFSYLIFILSGITLLFIGSKYYKGYIKDDFISQEKALGSFSVVVAEPGAQFVLKKGSENKINQRYLKNSAPNFAPFLVRNDTLFVYQIKKKSYSKQVLSQEEYFLNIPNIFCQNVKSIVAKENSTISLKEFQADSLNINLNSSSLDWWSFAKVSFVFLQAKDSRIYFNGEKMENVVMQLDNTRVQISPLQRIDNLSGSLKNKSDCTFTISKKVNLDVDETSNYNSYPPNNF